ncbi:peptidoglycan DD-metalloendopeptidase family protein [Brevirhabdus sp.]|uniref:peptidoglycan DD-metalloendopeptidase family protein n=1 Tax=Brevirhabdus sp. TaxID=2004514 RepID=UPI004059446E
MQRNSTPFTGRRPGSGKAVTLSLGAALLLGACAPQTGLDADMRSFGNGFETSSAAAEPGLGDRPRSDARGVISYPSYQVALARSGDRVSDVASRVGVDARQLAEFNGLNTGTRLRSGELLALPTRVAGDIATTAPQQSGGFGSGADGQFGAAPTSGGAGSERIDITTLASNAIDRSPTDSPAPRASRTAPAAATAAPEPIRHQVQRGETAFTISRKYNVKLKSLAEWNGLNSQLVVREGQYLIIPTSSAPNPRAGLSTTVAPGRGSPTPPPPSASKPLPQESPEARTAALPASPNLASQRTPAASGGGKFAYPVSGSIIRAYSKGKNDGIDLASKAGTPVKAAGEGEVAAITRDTDQVPILVLRHPDNLLTVYANIGDIAVKKGDKVSRGQTLAKVRNTSPSFLHFEVRKGFESVDPVPYLK